MVRPNFLIIGAVRSGTTSLYNNLIQHPNIFMPVKKELHYFSHFYDKGINWYQDHFIEHTNEKMIGEVSVSYTYPTEKYISIIKKLLF